PNGAGKTTTLNAVVGVLPVKSGRILLQGRDVTRERTFRRVSRRLALIPEGRQLWQRMTVEENLMLDGHALPELPAFGNEREAAADAAKRALARHVAALEQYAAALDGQHAHDGVQRGGFSRAVW